jgi:hypothetical protein
MANRLKLSSKYYDLDDYLFSCVTARFARQNTLKAFDFYAIVTWKSNRSISKVKNGLVAAKLTPTVLMSKVSACASDQNFKIVTSQTMPKGIAGYFNAYLPACRALAIKQNMTLRELDKAMWGLSKRKSILQWTK